MEMGELRFDELTHRYSLEGAALAALAEVETVNQAPCREIYNLV